MEQENKRYMQIAQEMNLLALGNSAGVVYWKPAGLQLYENLKNFIRRHHVKRGYLEVKTPSIVYSDVFEKSGHIEKYEDKMFFLHSSDEEGYALRPMSCPNHILLYKSELRSYRQLPLPLFEFGEVFRNESSGSLQVLFRQRQFCQDDSHVFVNKENLISSLSEYISMSREVYSELGFEKIHYAISLRPEKRYGSDEVWDSAEESLREACRLNEVEFEELPNEGAFYGPKLELQVQDKLGRYWQLGVIQLDYILPERFDLEYIDSNNQVQQPIMLHHAVLGSLERMIGILLESFGHDLPPFLHPYPKVVIAISEKSHEYAKKLALQLDCICDSSSDPLGKKLANWRNKGVPEIYVVGEKEALIYNEDNIFRAILNKGKNKEEFIQKKGNN
jgi:threonyl-tRNA synthetase